MLNLQLDMQPTKQRGKICEISAKTLHFEQKISGHFHRKITEDPTNGDPDREYRLIARCPVRSPQRYVI